MPATTAFRVNSATPSACVIAGSSRNPGARRNAGRADLESRCAPAGTHMPQFVLALDQGTTSSRSILFDAAGKPVATAQREFKQHFPRPAGSSTMPRRSGRHRRRRSRECSCGRARRRATSPPIGITNQRETTVLWDRRTGRPIAPAIVWQDRRTATLCAALQADGLEPEVARRTGLLLDPYFSGTKLAWLLDNVPGARRRAEDGELAFGTIDSWLVWKLTDGERHVTDVSNARRTLLLNIASAEWDDFMLALCAFRAPCCRRSCLRRSRGTAPVATFGGATCRSPASPATSRPRCSARRASSPAWPRTPTARAASC